MFGWGQLSSDKGAPVEVRPPSITQSEFEFDSVSSSHRSPPTRAHWAAATKEKSETPLRCAAQKMFDGRAMGTVLPASIIDELSVVEELSHQFVRRLSAPDTHQVDTDEGDIGM